MHDIWNPWRPEAWEIMRQRPDVKFYLLTKRPQRVAECLPPDWGDGWENILLNVTCENQRRAEERMPLLMALPFKHKGVMCAPFIGPVSLAPWLGEGQIEQVVCGEENYDGARPCHFDWVQKLSRECAAADVTFCLIETGSCFVKDGKAYHLKSKRLQSIMAFQSGVSRAGKAAAYRLTDGLGIPLRKDECYQPRFGKTCARCGSRLICNGCAGCAQCRFAEEMRHR